MSGGGRSSGMTRVATYECPCCSRRVHLGLDGDVPAPRSVTCMGWCARCEGTCLGTLRCAGVEAVAPIYPL